MKPIDDRAGAGGKTDRLLAAGVAGRTDDGFTILEMVIALVILSLGIAALDGAIADALGRTTRASQEQRVARLADNVLSRLGTDIAFDASESSGEAGGIHWVITTRPHGTDEDQRNWVIQPVEIYLTLSWYEAGRHRMAVWSTMRPTIDALGRP